MYPRVLMKGLRRRNEDNAKKIEASQSFTIHLSNLVNYKDVFINSYGFNFRVCSTNFYCVYFAVQIKLLWLKPAKNLEIALFVFWFPQKR